MGTATAEANTSSAAPILDLSVLTFVVDDTSTKSLEVMNSALINMRSNVTTGFSVDGEMTDNNRTSSTPKADFENPFDLPVVKFMFIALYSIVFLVCCVGNSLVLYTIGRNKRMRTRTNFFLANLAVADLSVGVVCVLPKLSTFLSPTWLLGEAMCKIYYFAQSMTYTASILLLTAIAIERYIAITHPLRSKCLVTQNRLIMAQVFIWLLSAAYNCPELSMFNTFSVQQDNNTVTYCFPTNPYANMRDYHTVNFVLWYVLPLSIMMVMYIRVACTLWKSSKFNDQTSKEDVHMRRLSRSSRSRTGVRQETVLCYDASMSLVHTRKLSRHLDGHPACLNDSMRQVQTPRSRRGSLAAAFCCVIRETNKMDSEDIVLQNNSASDGPELRNGGDTTPSVRTRFQMYQPQTTTHVQPQHHNNHHHHHHPRRYLSCDFTSDGDMNSSEEYDMVANNGHSRRVRCQYRVNSERVLSSRRRVIRLLVMVLVTFAVCVFPYHLKHLLFFWHIYPTAETKLDIISPLAYVMLYMNSALNPILYWVFSDGFRRSLTDSCTRSCFFRSHSRIVR